MFRQDAVEYSISGNIQVFYFYNPFEFGVLEIVLEGIQSYVAEREAKNHYIIYIDPRQFGRLDPDAYQLIYDDTSLKNLITSTKSNLRGTLVVLFELTALESGLNGKKRL